METLRFLRVLSLIVVKCTPNSKTSMELYQPKGAELQTARFFILQGLESEKLAHQFKDVTWPH